MEAKKCDMCKKFYDSKDVRNQKMVIRLKPDHNSWIDYELTNVDLCNECHDKILQMINIK